MAVDTILFANDAGKTTATPPRLVCWVPPSQGVTLNTDGSSFGYSGSIYGSIGLADSIHLILVDDIQYHQYAGTIMQIRDFIGRDWVVKLQHILRESNSSADFLAKREAQQNENLVILNAPPQEKNFMLPTDASGVQFLRE
ncbi:Reverse transcriptase-like [Sesbania bispinosa]|nr:Reverse transcriptase-like [Sesbania bispinosa]